MKAGGMAKKKMMGGGSPKKITAKLVLWKEKRVAVWLRKNHSKDDVRWHG